MRDIARERRWRKSGDEELIIERIIGCETADRASDDVLEESPGNPPLGGLVLHRLAISARFRSRVRSRAKLDARIQQCAQVS